MSYAASSTRVRDLASARAALAGAVARHWLVPTAGLCAGIPVLVSTIRALGAGWAPIGDQGIIATRAYDVLTSHTPLLGQYSEASIVTGHPTYSPGPLLYWLLALPARFGAPASLTLTMAAANVASIVGVVALARRRGGAALALASATAIALMCVSFSSESLHDVFNPSAGLFPFTLLAFMCLSLACGDQRLLPLIVLVASYVTQCHLAFLLPSVGLILVGLVGLRIFRRSAESPPPLGGPVRAALLVAIVCWSAPVVDQIVHKPGNFSALVSQARTHRPTEGLARGWRATVQAVGFPPRWLRPPASTGRLAGVSGGDYGDTRLADVTAPPATGRVVSAALLLAALVAIAAVAARRGRRDLAAAALIGLVLCAALAGVVTVTAIKAENTLGYSIWWGSVAGMWAWLVVLWAAAVLVRSSSRVARLRAPAFASLIGVAAAAGAGSAIAAAKGPDTHDPYYRPTNRLAAAFDRAIPRGRTVWLLRRGGATVAIEPTIRYTLRRRNVRALGRFASRRPGSWYELDHRRYDYVASVNAGVPPRFRPFRVVGRAVMVRGGAPMPLTATLSAGNRRRRHGARTRP